MDDTDLSGRFDDIRLQTSLHQSRKDEPVEVATGECLFCGEAVAPPRRWCNFDCMTDWERDNGFK